MRHVLQKSDGVVQAILHCEVLSAVSTDAKEIRQLLGD